MYKVLYYPDFVPDRTWLRRALLLCDGVVRIVPEDVRLDEPDDLKHLQDILPGCLQSEAPGPDDVALEYGDEGRLNRALRVIATHRERSRDELDLTISEGGHLSITDHVFVHDAKLSNLVFELLREHGLLNEAAQSLAPDRFYVVQRDASDLILSGVASRMARRLAGC
jgi:hypothetical protein